MSTVKEIEAAIRALRPRERARLVKGLPTILPELAGDAEWERLVRDPRPRPTLSALADEVEARVKSKPDAFDEITDNDFDRRS